MFSQTVHSYTNDQKLLDSSHKKDLRRARAAGLNIIPTSTGAGSALSLIFPELKNRIQGMAFRVPTANVSLLDLVVETKKKTSLNEIYKIIEQASLTRSEGDFSYREKAFGEFRFYWTDRELYSGLSFIGFTGSEVFKNSLMV